jgi:hypothetical protein
VDADRESRPRRVGFGPGRVLLVSAGFPVVAWFLASRVGLGVALAAVIIWWIANRPRVVCWAACVECLAAAPLALFLQGLPGSNVVGADFGTKHWLASDLAIAALVFGAFAALIELLGMDVRRASSGRLARLGRRLGKRARSEPRDRTFPQSIGRGVDQGTD